MFKKMREGGEELTQRTKSGASTPLPFCKRSPFFVVGVKFLFASFRNAYLCLEIVFFSLLINRTLPVKMFSDP